MRAAFLVACGSAAVAAAAVACAASGNNEQTAPDAGPSETVIPDGATADVEPDAESDAGVDAPRCSKAGWCETALPDSDLVMLDISPLPGRAFAIAESPTLGVKVLEWSDADGKPGTWRYIDDYSQNEPGLGAYSGKIWAPSDNDVYFGVGPGYVYHGTRPSVTAAWTWSRRRLQDNSHDTVHPDQGNHAYLLPRTSNNPIGIWGTSGSNVYAWFANTIYRWKSVDGGAPDWIPEYVADDADNDNANEHLFITGAAGTSPDDVWFSAVRWTRLVRCAVLVRRTGTGYQRIADGTPSGSVCTPRDGALMIGGSTRSFTDLQAVAADQLVGLNGGLDLVRISVVGDSYAVDLAPVPLSRELGVSIAYPVASLWTTPGSTWLSGRGLVIRGSGDVLDTSSLELSSVALNGALFNYTLLKIRGTSNTNIWAVGERNALHKTTP